MNKFINVEPNGVRGLERFLDNNSVSYEKGNASKLNYTRFEFDDVDEHDFKIIVDYVKKYNIKYNLKENKMNKLIENKLRKLVQKEIKSVLKEQYEDLKLMKTLTNGTVTIEIYDPTALGPHEMNAQIKIIYEGKELWMDAVEALDLQEALNDAMSELL